jgi:hypothetical protein
MGCFGSVPLIHTALPPGDSFERQWSSRDVFITRSELTK